MDKDLLSYHVFLEFLLVGFFGLHMSFNNAAVDEFMGIETLLTLEPKFIKFEKLSYTKMIKK